MIRYLLASFWFIFGLIWAVVGTPFLIIGIFWLHSEYQIQTHGVSATGTVVQKYHGTTRNGSSNYGIKYVFNDAAGKEHIDTVSSLAWEKWRMFNDGERIPVIYLPDKPTRSRLAANITPYWWVGPGIFLFLGASFASVGWILLIRAWIKCHDEVAMMRTGYPVQGQITGMYPELNVRINNRNPNYLTYKFTGPDEKVREGRTPYLSRKLEDKYSRETTITVVYDPRNPDHYEADIFGFRSRLGNG